MEITECGKLVIADARLAVFDEYNLIERSCLLPSWAILVAEGILSVRRLGLLTTIALAFAVAFLSIIIAQRGNPNVPTPNPPSALQSVEGKLSIQSIDDLIVGAHRIILCGVAFEKPQSMRAMVTEAARRDYQGLALICKRVGTGTPCDGNVASKFGAAIVVQCFMPGGLDLATKLVQDGILCGKPAQAGTTYKPCQLSD
ncbi:hypothetical protein [Mesorhizobium sp. M1399]|uniref:hypothetical protein n=1 Tax=Mesorhizobium sp. M1399 TaxID=2957096 RepID=UPI00333A0D4D